MIYVVFDDFIWIFHTESVNLHQNNPLIHKLTN